MRTNQCINMTISVPAPNITLSLVKARLWRYRHMGFPWPQTHTQACVCRARFCSNVSPDIPRAKWSLTPCSKSVCEGAVCTQTIHGTACRQHAALRREAVMHGNIQHFSALPAWTVWARHVIPKAHWWRALWSFSQWAQFFSPVDHFWCLHKGWRNQP